MSKREQQGIDMVKTIWTPDTFFPNEKKSFFHEATSHNSFLRIDSHGNVLRSIRLTVTANCPMNLHTDTEHSMDTVFPVKRPTPHHQAD
ncbi:hypothetical protein COOONC_12639 [Cooperia oncophora]